MSVLNRKLIKSELLEHYIILYYINTDPESEAFNSVGANVFIQDCFNEDIMYPLSPLDYNQALTARIDAETVKQEYLIRKAS